MVSIIPSTRDLYTVCTSGTRPPSPTAGQRIHETDTGRDLVWNGVKSAWLPPWNTAWGRLKAAQAVGTAFDTTQPVQVVFGSTFKAWTNRTYRFKWQMVARTATGDCLIRSLLQLDGGGGFATEVDKRGTFALGTAANSSEAFLWDHDWTPPSDGMYSARFLTDRLTATATTTTPSLVWIGVDDIGPLNGDVHP